MPSSFSPVLFLGMLIKPLPNAPLNRAIKKISRRLCLNHPSALQRLDDIAGTRFVIEPTDFPYAIEMYVTDGTIDVGLYTENQNAANVKISGTLRSLIAMLDSKADGDALFFSRKISVEGNTEALLTLRNALDSEEIDLRQEILDIFGPLRGIANLAASGFEQLIERAEKNMNILSEAIIAPITAKHNLLEHEIDELRNETITLKTKISQQQKHLERISKKVMQ